MTQLVLAARLLQVLRRLSAHVLASAGHGPRISSVYKLGWSGNFAARMDKMMLL